jgi:isochorismate pyruvate lyase
VTTVTIDERPAPADCQTMIDVRQGVDAIDRALVTLLVERQGYMEAAARIKQDRDAVYDAARIEQVIERVTAAAKTAGLSVEIAEPVWRKLVERCIAHEFVEWDRLRKGG